MKTLPTSGDQFERQIPQALGVPGVDCIGCTPARKIRWTLRDCVRLVAILEVKAADALEKRRGGEQYGCRCPLGRGLAPLDWGLQAAGVLLQTGRDRTGIERIGSNAVCPTVS